MRVVVTTDARLQWLPDSSIGAGGPTRVGGPTEVAGADMGREAAVGKADGPTEVAGADRSPTVTVRVVWSAVGGSVAGEAVRQP